MHDNVDISRELSDTKQLFDSVLVSQGRGEGVGGGSDEVLANISKGILDKLPEDFDLDEAGKRYPVVYSESMNTVLVQELERYNK